MQILFDEVLVAYHRTAKVVQYERRGDGVVVHHLGDLVAGIASDIAAAQQLITLSELNQP